MRFQYAVEPFQNERRQPAEFLIGTHHVEIEMDGNSEPLQYGFEQMAVLGGNANAGFEPVAMAREFMHHGGELDGFGPGTQNDEDMKAF